MEKSFILLSALPLLQPALGWLLGLVLARLDAVPLWLCLLLWCFTFLLWLKWRNIGLLACGLGMAYGLVSFVWDVHSSDVPEKWLHHTLEVTATIDAVRQTQTYTRLTLTRVTSKKENLPGVIHAYVYRQQQVLQPGMQVAMRIKLRLPHNKQNPSYFDYEQYCFEQRIVAMGSVRGGVKVLEQDISWVDSLRDHVRVALSKLDDEAEGVLLALLLADRSLIPLHIDDAFAASGATHLLAISGLHVGLVAGWGFILAWWLFTRRESWIVTYPVRALALSFGVLLAASYASLAGWPIPAQRASLMLLAGVLAWWFRAHHVPLNTMLAALMLIVLFDPASVLSVSLWLSFIATSALLVWASSQPPAETVMAKVWMWLKGMFWVSMVASLATLPVIGFVFERFPTWSLLANVLLVPLYSLWVLPLALLGELAAILRLDIIADVMFQCSAWGIAWGSYILLFIQQLPAGNLWLRGDMPWVCGLLLCCFLVAGALWLKARHIVAILLVVSGLLAYVYLMTAEAKVDKVMLHAWDVGQGASTLLQLHDFNLLIDVPGTRGSKFNGGTIAADNARGIGLLQIDAVVLTHAQSDHAGGIARLFRSLNGVKELWLADVPANRRYPAIQNMFKYVTVRWLQQGDRIDLGYGTSVEVLWPPAGYAPSNANNASLVLRVTLATGQSLLLPGDIEKHVEQRILQSLAAVDVLLMPHHGSKTSSTPAFVRRVKPQVVIAQTGYQNHYGFPKPEVVQRYTSVGGKVYNTAEGAVVITFDSGSMVVQQFVVRGASKREDVQYFLQKL